MEKQHVKGLFLGIGAVVLGHLGWTIISALGLIFPIFIIGLAQLIYVIPLAVAVKRPGFAQGVWIAAGITFLLNAACFGLLFGGLDLLDAF